MESSCARRTLSHSWPDRPLKRRLSGYYNQNPFSSLFPGLLLRRRFVISPARWMAFHALRRCMGPRRVPSVEVFSCFGDAVRGWRNGLYVTLHPISPCPSQLPSTRREAFVFRMTCRDVKHGLIFAAQVILAVASPLFS